MTRAHPKNKKSSSFSGSIFDASTPDIWEILVDSGILIYDRNGKYQINARGIMGTFSINPKVEHLTEKIPPVTE